MSNTENEENLSTSSDDDDDDDDDNSSSSSSTTSSDDDDDDDEEDDGQIDEDSNDNLATLPLKQAYAALETKRKMLNKRLIELRDELKAQPQADIEIKKRLLTEIKNLREKWIANQTRLTNLKARLSHSPTPERKVQIRVSTKKSPEITIEPEIRVIPPPRIRTQSYSSSSRSRSRSRDSSRSSERSYHDLDALNDNKSSKISNTLSSRPTTSYRDLTEDHSISRSPSPLTIDGLPSSDFSLPSSKMFDENLDEPDELSSNETFYNQTIPYPIVNDKRDLEIMNRQLKNQLRQLEASRNNPIFDQKLSLINYERLKKQNEFINLRLRIERLKKTKGKTQKEKEQNKKQFHLLLQEFRKLQRFMRSANRDSANNQFLTFDPSNYPSSIPLPASPQPKQSEPVPSKQQQPIVQKEEFKLPPLDLTRVTGKKIVFESSDSDDDEQPTTVEPQVPVSLSASEPRTVPDQLPIPSNSSSSATLDAIKTRVANLMQTTNSSAIKSKQAENNDGDDDDDDDENEDKNEQSARTTNPERAQAISAKFNRKRRKGKRNRNKKKQSVNAQASQQATNENDALIIDQEEAWKRHVAMQLQSTIIKASNPILRALTAEAYKKLGISQDEVNEFQFDDDIMDYETALILQQQQEFLAAAAANPFNVLHNAAVGSSSSRPNLVDVLSNLNGGIIPSSSEPQTPMGLLQKFFLDANNNSNLDQRAHLNDLSSTPPTPPSPRDISIGKKIVESLTHQDINALLKLSGSEHDDDEDDDDDNQSYNADTDDDIHQFSFDDDSNDMFNGNNNHAKVRDKRGRSMNVSSNRNNQTANLMNKKSTIETLILPSFNRCTHLGKSTKRTVGVERMFPSFSKHNSGPSSTLSLILYGLSSTP